MMMMIFPSIYSSSSVQCLSQKENASHHHTFCKVMNVKQASPPLCAFVQGVAVLHSRNIIHGSLSPRKILIDERGNARLTSFSAVQNPHSSIAPSPPPIVRNDPELAPEILREGPSAFSFASDLWSFGCVCMGGFGFFCWNTIFICFLKILLFQFSFL